MSAFSRIVSAGATLPGLISSAPVRASLVPEQIGMPLLFHFNPDKVTITKETRTQGKSTLNVNSYQEAVTAVGNLSINVDKCRFAGYTTKMAMDQLVEWATPQPKLGALGTVASVLGSAISAVMGGQASQSTTRILGGMGALGDNVEYVLPVLRFSWGFGGALGLGYKVMLESVTINYERFDPYGIPIYATANLKMKDYTEPLPYNNPTSGGLPGRTKHVVTAGESVVSIAQRSYGSPNAWRALAEANGLDDPLRVKPGRTLYLPGQGELEAS